MQKMTVLKAFFPLFCLFMGIANAQTPNSVPLSPTQIQSATNTAIEPNLPGGITAVSLNGIINQFDPFTNLWFDASNAQNGLLNKWSGTAWVPLVLTAANGGTPSTAAQNTIFAGPATGGSGTPTFRSLDASDLTTPLLTPPPIGTGGGSTPNSIGATTLSASGAVTGAGFAAFLASPSCIGCTAPAAVAATTLSGGSGTFAVNATGTVAQNPTTAFASGVVPGINQLYAATGSAGTALSANINQLYLSSDTLAVNGAPSSASLAILAVYDLGFGGSAMTGGRIAGDFALFQTSASEATHVFRDYVALHGTVSTTGDGGGVGTEKGMYFGLWSSNILTSTAHVSALTGLEVDMIAPTGSTVQYKSAIGPIGGSTNDAVQGSIVDAILWLAASPGDIGSKVGIQFGRSDGFGGLGVSTTGTLLSTAVETATIGNGIDLTGGGTPPLGNTTITGNAWKSPGAVQTTVIDGNGNIKANSVNLPNLASFSWGSGLGQIVLATDTIIDNVVPGDLVFRTTAAAEVFRFQRSGIMKVVGASGFAANASVATALSSVGPTGSHTTVQEWLVVQDSAGTTRYIPAF